MTDPKDGDDLRCPFTGVQWNDRRARAAVLRAVWMADVESDGWREALADDILERLRGDEHLPGRRSLLVAGSSNLSTDESEGAHAER